MGQIMKLASAKECDIHLVDGCVLHGRIHSYDAKWIVFDEYLHGHDRRRHVIANVSVVRITQCVVVQERNQEL